jgi:putative transposase
VDASVDIQCVMPNHVHAIISISEGRGGVTPPLQKPTLGQMVAFYKYNTTKEANELLGKPGQRFWQRGFYEHIIRDERDYETRWNYILGNPANWELDEENV